VPGVRVGLVADDLTGACDSAVPFLAGGRVVVGIWPELPTGDLACSSVSTESRAEPPATSFDRSRRAAGFLRAEGASTLYRKVDSQLRGNVAADFAGVLQDHRGPCLFSPALPLAGRTTVGGRQRWDGHEVNLVSLLATVGRPVHRGRPEEYASGTITVCDAQSDDELANVAQAATTVPGIMPAGTAGLAHHLARLLGTPDFREPGWPACKRPAAVIGSPAARAQAEYAIARGWTVHWLSERGASPDLSGCDGLFVSGGETAVRVLRSTGATGIELVGEAMPLVAVGLIISGRMAGIPVALKGGSFGSVRAIDECLRRLAAGA
jgi:uncharacterized protein YgbK (DUF1537 family)